MVAKFSIAILALSPVWVLAQPLVTGTTIAWPDDGWYQVQSAEDFTTICEGGLSCTVSAGRYNVINHSTGERFENIEVADPGSSAGSAGSMVVGSVTTDGSRILWPDDGWYQVQTAQDYVSVCEGGRSCDVSPGSYNVINLTTGQRTEGVVVGSGGDSTIDPSVDSSPGAAAVFVDGGTIFLPDDGWYQVQSAADFSQSCEGTRSCAVSPGQYIVINHSNGVRQEVTVADSGAGFVGESGSGSGSAPGSIVPVPAIEFDLPADFGATPAPDGISLAVYSGSTAELNWIRPLFSDGIQVNEIWRDGMLLEEIPGGGNSYVDATRTPGLAYTYHIVAINSSGRSTTQFVESNPSVANPFDPVITTQGLPGDLSARIGNMFHMLNGRAIERMFLIARRIVEAEPADMGLSSPRPDDFRGTQYDCTGGGVMTLERLSFTLGFRASNCRVGPLTIDGIMFFPSDLPEIQVWSTRLTTIHDSRDDVTISIDQTTMRFNEETRAMEFFSSDEMIVSGPIYNYSSEEVRVSRGVLDDGSEFYQIRDGVNIANAPGTLSRMRVDDIFAIGDNGHPRIGAAGFYSLNAGNETYGFNANNNNPETFTLNETINGELTSYDIPWSDSFTLGFGEPLVYDVGF